MKYKVKQIMSATNSYGKSRIVEIDEIVELIDDDLVTDDSFIITTHYRNLINDIKFFEPLREININLNNIKEESFNTEIEKKWRIQLDFLCTEKKAEEIKALVYRSIRDIEL